MTNTDNGMDGQICFGLDREQDEQSMAMLAEMFGNPQLMTVLAPRLTDEEIEAFVDLCMTLMRRHLSHEEYHRLFLQSNC